MCHEFKASLPWKGGGKILKNFEATCRITRRPKPEEHSVNSSFITVLWKAPN
jgi:hypothetical protein